MAIVVTDDKNYKAIADTIRQNGGPKFDLDEKFTPEQMPSAIVKVGEFQYEEGGVSGYGRGYEAGSADGYASGYRDGRAAGYNSGKADGIAVGVVQGRQAEYDEFWDNYQENGNRKNYEGAFAGAGWSAKTLKPKYDISPNGSMSQIFWGNANKIDLVDVLKSAGVSLDTSKSYNISNAFSYCSFTRVGTIDASSAPVTTYTVFGNASNLETIEKLVIGNKAYTFNSWFNDCSALKNLTIEGVISSSGLNLQWSTLLSKVSIVSVVNALSTTTSGLTVTLSKAAVNKAFETSVGANDGSTSAEWLALAATKSNWTISLL